MPRNSRTLLMLLAPVVLSLFLAVPGLFAASFKLPSMQIELWPEYDQPRMLVIYRVQLPPDRPSPARLEFRIPASAGKPNAVAAGQAPEQLNNLPYSLAPGALYQTIVVTTTDPVFRLEYYDDLQRDNQARHYRFTWPGDYEVDDLEVRVQQPIDSSQVTLEPSFGSSTAGADNLTYYQHRFGHVTAGQTVNVGLSYVKADDQLTAAVVEANNPPAASSGSPPQPGPNPWLVAAIVLIVLSLAGLVIWFILTRRSEPLWNRPAMAPSSRRAARKAVRGHPVKPQTAPPPTWKPAAAENTPAGYCHRCGTPYEADGQFCRKCGAKLKR